MVDGGGKKLKNEKTGEHEKKNTRGKKKKS